MPKKTHVKPKFASIREPFPNSTRNRILWVILLVLVAFLAINFGLSYHYKTQIENAILTHQEALHDLGNTFARIGQLDRAITLYQEALKLKPKDAEVHYRLGLALREAGREEEAALEFAQARRLDPTLKLPDPETSEGRPAKDPKVQILSPEALERKITPELPAAETKNPPRFAVQVGAFRNRATSVALAQRLAADFPQTRVTPKEVRGEILYRVVLPVQTKEEVEILAAHLRDIYKLEILMIGLP